MMVGLFNASPVAGIPDESPFANTALFFNAPVGSLGAFSDTVNSVISGESEFAVATSSSSKSFVWSTVGNAFVVFHFESEVADTGSFSIVGVDVPMSVLGTSETVNSVQSGESLFTVASSSWGHSFIGSTVRVVIVMSLGRGLIIGSLRVDCALAGRLGIVMMVVNGFGAWLMNGGLGRGFMVVRSLG